MKDIRKQAEDMEFVRKNKKTDDRLSKYNRQTYHRRCLEIWRQGYSKSNLFANGKGQTIFDEFSYDNRKSLKNRLA